MPNRRLIIIFTLFTFWLPLLMTGTAVEAVQLNQSLDIALTHNGALSILVPATISETQTISDTISLTVATDKAPTYIKGLYMTYHAAGHEGLRSHALDLIDQTELNALVLDIKGDLGLITYKSDVITATAIGANEAPTITDWAAFMAEMEERDIYTIARIVVFKDNYLARAHPEWAVKDSAGNLWFDGEDLPWLEPFHEAVWDYNIALAVEAAERGFDEVQFDYIRFPTDGNIGNIVYSQPADTPELRAQAITGLLAKVDAALAPYPTNLAADVFGYTTWYEGDFQIGQDLSLMAPYLDVISPMLYPSTYSYGLPGLPEYSFAVAHPYQIVYQSMLRGMGRVKATNPDIIVRPWIQDFPDYAFDGRIYTPQEIRAQMEAVYDSGGGGWLLWDPRVQYTPAALVSDEPLYPPNESGEIMVWRYNQFGEADSHDVRRLASFRQDLERLRAAGYYPVNLRDLKTGKVQYPRDMTQLNREGGTPLQIEAMMQNRLHHVPAGKRPIVLTFDGSHISQYRLLPDGQLDPNSALGVLYDFHREHPADWPLRATFLVQPDAADPASTLFGQPATAAQKLQTLIDWGMEVGLYQPVDRAETVSFQVQIQSQVEIIERLIEGDSLDSLALSLRDETLLHSPLRLTAIEPLFAQFAVITMSDGWGVPLSQSPPLNAQAVSRIQATPQNVTAWLDFYQRHPDLYYVSAGSVPIVRPVGLTEVGD